MKKKIKEPIVDLLHSRWVPVRKGKTYCAPSCGRGCTHAEFRHATAAGAKLAKQLGAGWWEPEIWENLGWHYRVRLTGTGLSVYPPGGRSKLFTAYLSTRLNDSDGHWAAHGDTPDEAIRAVLVRANDEITSMIKAYYEAGHTLRNSDEKRWKFTTKKLEPWS